MSRFRLKVMRFIISISLIQLSREAGRIRGNPVDALCGFFVFRFSLEHYADVRRMFWIVVL